MDMEMEYEFEEIPVDAGGGIQAWGLAILALNREDHPEEFHVKSITFDGVVTVNRADVARKRGLLQELSMMELIFNVVAHKIESDKDAQLEWDFFVDAYNA